MATAVLHPLPIQHTASGILINPSHISFTPSPNTNTNNNIAPSNSKRFSTCSSNNSLASSSSSSGNITDVSSYSTHQSLSQSPSATKPKPHQLPSTLSRSATRSSSPNTRRSRIRFAPLPDPRALESVEADENGVELEFDAGGAIASNFDDSDAGCSSLSSSLVSSLPFSTSKQSSCTSIEESSTCLPSSIKGTTRTTTSPPDSSADEQRAHASGGSSPTIKKASSGWTSKPKKLFKPFLRRSSLPMPPASSSGLTAEDILTLGTINLFRSTSREPRGGNTRASSDGHSPRAHGRNSSWGSPLSRWTSLGTQKNKEKEYGSPLSRTQSAQSHKSDTSTRPTQTRPATVPSTSSSPKSNSPPQSPRKSRLKGTKMLNGRVYGGRRINAQNTNLFATAKDEDPEFVEWGYGGMGSVKSRANGGSQWSRLQSGDAMGLKSTGSGGGDDDDDGGGMSWVKKRKEQRERQKLEEEAKAKLEAEGKANVGDAVTPETTAGIVAAAHTEAVLSSPESEPASAKSHNTGLPVQEQDANDPFLAPPASIPIPTDEAALSPNPPSSSEEHRITTAVTVPAPPHHRVSHHRSNSATHSLTSGVHLPGGMEGERERAWSPLRSSSLDPVERGRKEDVIPADLKQEDDDEEDDNASRSGSGSNSESDSEAGEDESEDEDDAEAEQIRKTALGAGVEKISRLNKDER